MYRIIILAATSSILCIAPVGGADTFDRHGAYWLQQTIKNSPAVAEMSSRQAAELKLIGQDISAPCIVVRTGDGNVAKVLLSWAFRKAEPKPVPVLVLERFVTYDRDRPNIAIANGKNVMLFPGFLFDLDIGQVVPGDSGGDITFNDKRRLLAVDKATVHGLNGSALPAGEDAEDPSSHQGVVPKDFAGTWNIDADGRVKGTWTLSVDDEGNVDGQHLATESQSTFPVSGRVTDGNRLLVEVQFAVATQNFDLYLWTSDKSRMAGTTVFTDRKFGVIATRQPKKAPPAQEKEPAPAKPDEQQPGKGN